MKISFARRLLEELSSGGGTDASYARIILSRGIIDRHDADFDDICEWCGSDDPSFRNNIESIRVVDDDPVRV